MKKRAFWFLSVLLILVMASGTLLAQELKELDVFTGEPLPEYPGSTIIGDIIRAETGVKLNREALVGDLETKVGLMIASGDYPDMVVAAHFTSLLKDAGALLPLNELIEEHAPNLKRLYANHWEMLQQDDGNVYWLPIQAIPYGSDTSRYPSLGFFMNARVLEDAGWPVVRTLDHYFQLIEDYQAKNPTINGLDTIGYLTLFDDWRSFATTNVPQHLMGYPNEGEFVPVMVQDEYVVQEYHTSNTAKRYYQKLNEMYNKGVVDKETFIINYDQYIERISSGRVLGTFNQFWQVQEAQNYLLRDDPDSVLVPLPIVIDTLVEERLRDIPYVQPTQGMGITVACDDPVEAIKYLDYLISEDTQRLIQWGVEGDHYEVDEQGLYYRTPEQLALFRDPDWVQNVFGRQYFHNAFPSLRGLDENGNMFFPDTQPHLIYSDSHDAEKKVMDAYGVKSFSDLFNEPIFKKYFPLWTITMPAGSAAHIEETRMKETLNRYVPEMVMSSPEQFENIWANYVKDIRPLLVEQMKLYQTEIDWRMENW